MIGNTTSRGCLPDWLPHFFNKAAISFSIANHRVSCPAASGLVFRSAGAVAGGASGRARGGSGAAFSAVARFTMPCLAHSPAIPATRRGSCRAVFAVPRRPGLPAGGQLLFRPVARPCSLLASWVWHGSVKNIFTGYSSIG